MGFAKWCLCVKESKQKSRVLVLVSLMLINVSILRIGFWKGKNNPKHCNECDFKCELCSHPENRLWSERWYHPNSRLATQAPFPSLNFSESRVPVLWLDGSGQQVFHIAHFTSCQASNNQNISPVRCSVLNSCLLEVMHGPKCFKGAWLKHACPHQEILPAVSCVGNWWYLRHTSTFRSDLALEAEMKSQSLTYWFGFKNQ